MTRSPFSELQENKMEESKRKTTTGSVFWEAAEEKAKRGESLQEAFKKFRKKRQVNIVLHL